MAAANYRFATLPRVDEQVRDLLKKASVLGIRDELLRALRTAYDELRSAPQQLGDPAWNTRKKGGVVYNAVIEPISVHYVVYQDERVVLLLDVKPLSRFFPDLTP